RVRDRCQSGCQRNYYGAIANPGVSGHATDIPSKVSSGFLPPGEQGLGRQTHAHEIGHSLGLIHSVDATLRDCIDRSTGRPIFGLRGGPCGECVRTSDPAFPHYVSHQGRLRAYFGPMDQGPENMVFGLDLDLRARSFANPIVSPFTTFDLMSYCQESPFHLWPSKVTYERLAKALGGVASQAGMAGLMPQPRQTLLVIRGMIDLTDQAVVWLPFENLEATFPPDVVPPGDYELILQDGAGTTVYTRSFQPTRNVGLGDPSSSAIFVLTVPADPRAKTVLLRQAGGGLAALRATPAPPSVAWRRSPDEADGIQPGDEIVLEWSATDSDGDPLTFHLDHSVDDGATWETLAIDLTEPRFVVNSAEIPAGAQSRFRVTASDGFHSASAITAASFTIPNHAPEIRIVSPVAGAAIPWSAAVVLSAAAHDLEDGVIPEDQLEWSSDLAGVLGQGPTLVLDGESLGRGNHRISVAATDGAGARSTLTVELSVDGPPKIRLMASMVDGLLELRWHDPDSKARLESTSELHPWPTWIPVDGSIQLGEDGIRTLRLSVGTAHQFFRVVTQ
ncbi:MAG: hypothetical protein AB7O66_16435, partial [Limisphaerales bacterium]